MFAVVYSFEVKKGAEKRFERSWAELTKLIREHRNSLGSRLHQGSSPTSYIAYAQWPDRKTWADSDVSMPTETEHWRSEIRASCTDIKTVYELDMVSDLLINQ